MANTQNSQAGGNKRSQSQNGGGSDSQSQNSGNPSSQNSSGASMSSGGSSDPIEAAITKAVHSLITNLEPQLNRVATQIVNRAMSRGQNIADTGVKRMQEQPWYMVGGALALVAVGVGLLFAFETDRLGSTPDFSNPQ